MAQKALSKIHSLIQPFILFMVFSLISAARCGRALPGCLASKHDAEGDGKEAYQ